MSPHEISRLRQGAFNSTVNEYSRSAERTDDHDPIGFRENSVMQKCDGGDPYKGAYPGPDNFGKIHHRRALGRPFHLIEVIHVVKLVASLMCDRLS